eukprot:gene13453-18043_t
MSDSDDDFGPKPVAVDNDDNEHGKPRKRIKTSADSNRTLPLESLYLDRLPLAEHYEVSYMHRDIVSHIVVAKDSEFIITGSVDGHVKFWKKMLESIEFVKHFQAHLGPIHAMTLSVDQIMLVTTSSDKMIKFFDIVGFDMSAMVAVAFIPTAACWLFSHGNICDRVAVADKDSSIIRIYRADGTKQPIQQLDFHTFPVRCLALNVVGRCVVSIDGKGVIEYWDVNSYAFPSSEQRVSFSMKSDTDLYDLAKARTTICSLAISPLGNSFATYSTDKKIRIFNFRSGKLTRKYDESVKAYALSSANENMKSDNGNQSQSLQLHSGMDSLEYGRRQAVERELESSSDGMSLITMSYDESGYLLLFGSLKGIKIVNIITNKVVRIIGSGEIGERFLAIALYQGVPKVDSQLLLSRAGAEGMTKTAEQLQSEPTPDPTIFCTSFNRRRFYCFSRRPPDESKESRDVLNEMPNEEEKNNLSNQLLITKLSSEVIFNTSFGDITIKLFASECPRTVENFTTHVKNGYYDNLIFHRVIKGFMIQTGDPLGDGTGGESIWGKEFEDEFVKTLRHDRPFTLSMANAGPNTNGSQFFITTAPTPWLDNKHTVFGRVTKGYEVISKIEGLKVNKYDKPYDEVKIIKAECLN